ncbi:MAG: DUF484 family protein [Alphaproteobacteria bacterium]|nr:DUF484 family protein [Alphaproteobacteria bacterium]MCB9931177.1 DUF484 family protein [Alphaproteobacteria bacterium]
MPRQSPKTSDKRRGPPAETLSADAVAAWLRQHPDFLADNPDLLLTLTPPDQRAGEAVVDFQRFMVERQQRELVKLKASSQELLAISRLNKATQQTVHRAVLALLAAPTFERAIATVVDEWAAYMDLDVVVLGIEHDGDSGLPALKAGLKTLAPGAVDSRLGRGNDVKTFAALDPVDPDLFGEAAPLAKSAAWLRLAIHDSAPPGLLALGSREEGRFHPRQNTELLRFLASALAATIRAWLDLPEPGPAIPL